MRDIKILVLILALPVLLGFNFNRDYRAHFEGDVDYTTSYRIGDRTYGEYVEGTGSAKIESTISASNINKVEHSVSIDIEATDSRKAIEAGVGIKLEDNIVYVTRIQPDSGEHAVVEQDVVITYSEFYGFLLDNYTVISGGILQRSVNFSKSDLFVKEVTNVRGSGWVLDHLRFAPEVE